MGVYFLGFYKGVFTRVIGSLYKKIVENIITSEIGKTRRNKREDRK